MSNPDRTATMRQKQHPRVARTTGVRTVKRPLPGGGELDLAYVRTGPVTDLPVLVLPGGPGLASVLPYRGLRARARKAGLDIVMVEHRGIGLSRTDDAGVDLPREAVTIAEVLDDAAAVLEAEGIDQVLVYGTSYGSYLAQGFGVRHPGRVAGMVLDSAMLGGRLDRLSGQTLRDLFWHGTPDTRALADTVRRLDEQGVIRRQDAGLPLQILFEFGGLPFVDRALSLHDRGRGQGVWRWLQGLGDGEVMHSRPFVMELDLVGEIAFRELDYAAAPDGDVLEPANAFRTVASQFSPFEREPFDLAAEIPAFSWPTVIVSGDRDIRTPLVVAERIAALVPGATLLPVRHHGHSALDSHPALALEVMSTTADAVLRRGTIDPIDLPSDPRGTRGLMSLMISARLALARIVPRSR